jgi:preprotein translocase subunit SecA
MLKVRICHWRRKQHYTTRSMQLIKDRDKELEVVLLDLLPQAFAVVKETSRRFSENESLEVTASQHRQRLRGT